LKCIYYFLLLFLIMKIARKEIEETTRRNITTPVYDAFSRCTVGIAGLGGLGSRLAWSLARLFPAKLIIADFDTVELSNMNRQEYFLEQIGMPKVAATRDNIEKINPYVSIETHQIRLTAENIPQVFARADIIAECFDKADQKQMLVETVLSKMKDIAIVSASGLAGYGRSNAITTKRISSRLVLVGDDVSTSCPQMGLIAPRVGVAAYHQANAIVELIVESKRCI
jgi:sulfur carrier protein ThiS adenylyltransferase